MMEEKLKIGIDIDEVVVEFFKKYLELFNEKFEKNIDFDSWTKYNIWDFTDISREDALGLVNEFQESGGLDDLELVEGVKEALMELNQKYEIYFITSRPQSIKEKTENFLKNLFSEFNFELHFSGGVWNDSKSKVTICNELGIKIMVEDNADYALGCAEKGVKVFLLDKPWNQNVEEHENVIRVRNWDEIMERLK